jgi:hypothetical protein
MHHPISRRYEIRWLKKQNDPMKLAKHNHCALLNFYCPIMVIIYNSPVDLSHGFSFGHEELVQ